MNASAATSINEHEIDKFNALAASWWNPDGPSKVLFAMGPARMGYIKRQLVSHFDLDANARYPLKGLKILDLGCGAGLISEPLARLGADVTGIDAAQENIMMARAHAKQTGLDIEYIPTTAEALVIDKKQFNAVVSLEVIEHVADAQDFAKSCHALLKPGGMFLFSTLNRTLESYAVAIVGAEYMTRLVPRGTHEWKKFITPAEMAEILTVAQFRSVRIEGLNYQPVHKSWAIGANKSINYIGAAIRIEV